jgi:hypothetical protein
VGGFSTGGLTAVNAAHGLGVPVQAVLSPAGIQVESAWTPGFGHFFPMRATSLGGDMTRLTLQARALRFLDRTLGVKR